MYPRGANASFCVVCCVKLYFVFLGLSLVKMFHLCPACNQDVHPSKGKFLCCARLYMCTLYATFIPSFGNFLSRCSIYWQGKLFACMCVCLCIVCATFMLSRCCIFRQLLVKMFHLLAVSCQDIHFLCVLQSVHMYCLCQDVPVCLCIVLQQRKCYSILSREIFMRICIILTALVLSRYTGRECL